MKNVHNEVEEAFLFSSRYLFMKDCSIYIKILYKNLRKNWCRLQMDGIVFTLGISKVMKVLSESTENFWDPYYT